MGSQGDRDGIYIDTSRWPIMQQRQIGRCSDAQVEAYLSEMDGLVSRGDPVVVVLDVRDAVPFNAAQRRKLAEWMERNPETMQRLLGIAFVQDSALIRGAMQAVFWLSRPRYPYSVFRTPEEAMGWAERMLGARRRHGGDEPGMSLNGGG